METMEWTKQSEEMFKTWTETQKKMWDDCLRQQGFGAMQGFGSLPPLKYGKRLWTRHQTIQQGSGCSA